jgi:hypothetical protein
MYLYLCGDSQRNFSQNPKKRQKEIKMSKCNQYFWIRKGPASSFLHVRIRTVLFPSLEQSSTAGTWLRPASQYSKHLKIGRAWDIHWEARMRPRGQPASAKPNRRRIPRHRAQFARVVSSGARVHDCSICIAQVGAPFRCLNTVCALYYSLHYLCIVYIPVFNYIILQVKNKTHFKSQK